MQVRFRWPPPSPSPPYVICLWSLMAFNRQTTQLTLRTSVDCITRVGACVFSSGTPFDAWLLYSCTLFAQHRRALFRLVIVFGRSILTLKSYTHFIDCNILFWSLQFCTIVCKDFLSLPVVWYQYLEPARGLQGVVGRNCNSFFFHAYIAKLTRNDCK